MKHLTALLTAATLTLALAPTLRADVAPSPERLQRRLERMRDKAAAAASGQAGPTPSVAPAPSGGPAPASSVAPALPEQLRVMQEHLRKRWSELAATRHERRERHRAELVRQVGQRLSDPAVKAELAQHATRLAELSRLEFLARNARSGAAREKLLARIAKLSARETERHRARIAKLAPSGGAAPSASAGAATASPAPSARAAP